MPELSLWNAENQQERLAELTADTADASKELPLRRDVRSLGMLLGKVLVEQGGEALLDVVEHLRRLFSTEKMRGRWLSPQTRGWNRRMRSYATSP